MTGDLEDMVILDVIEDLNLLQRRYHECFMLTYFIRTMSRMVDQEGGYF